MKYNRLIQFAGALIISWIATTLIACAPSTLATTPPKKASTTEPISTATQISATPSTLWRTYRNEGYGFSFEYPAVYEEIPYKDSCGIKETSDGIHLGHRIDLIFSDSGGLDLAKYTDNLLQTKDLSVVLQKNETVNDVEAITVEYRFGGMNRFGTFTSAKYGGRIFMFNFSAGSFCNIPEDQVAEFNAYSHMMGSFQFDK